MAQLRFKHYTVAVADLPSAVEQYRARFGMQPIGDRAFNKIGNFDFQPMGYDGQVMLHLIQPVDDGGPVAKLMKERGNEFNPHGEGIYLMAYETEDVDAFCAQVESHGGRVTRFPGMTNAWVHPTSSNFVLMEIFSAGERA